MKNDLVKCEQCGNIFNRAYLDQVMEHEHNGLDLGENIKGVQVGKKWPDSPNINSMYYNTLENKLEVTFKNFHTYIYDDVPMSVWMEALKVDNIGKFYADNIKGNYSFIQLNP